MVNNNDCVVITITEEELEVVFENAKKATLNGTSQIRSGANRKATCGTDNLAGQLGELALHKYFYGENGFEFYKQAREIRNANPKAGDGGRDLFDGKKHLNVDIKCSRLKLGAKAMSYNMVVPEKEYHLKWVYIAAFCGMNKDGTEKNDKVVLTGWVKSEDISKLRDFKGYGDRHFCQVSELRPLDSLILE